MFNNKRPREEPIFSEAFVVGCQGPVPWQGDGVICWHTYSRNTSRNLR